MIVYHGNTNSREEKQDHRIVDGGSKSGQGLDNGDLQGPI